MTDLPEEFHALAHALGVGEEEDSALQFDRTLVAAIDEPPVDSPP